MALKSSRVHALMVLIGVFVVALSWIYFSYLHTSARSADEQLDAERRSVILAEANRIEGALVEAFEAATVRDATFALGRIDLAAVDCAAPPLSGFPVAGLQGPDGEVAVLCEFGKAKDVRFRTTWRDDLQLADLAWSRSALSLRDRTGQALSEFQYRRQVLVRQGRLYLVLAGLAAPEANRAADARPVILVAASNLSASALPDLAGRVGVGQIRSLDSRVERPRRDEVAAAFGDGAVLVAWPGSRVFRDQLMASAPLIGSLSLLFIASLLVALRQLSRLHERVVASEREARHAATHDGMTGLPNRAYFNDLKAKALAEASPARPVHVGLLDIDFFKSVNDNYGHDVGDALIVAVAHRLQKTLGAQGVAARLGGDEFAFLIRGAASPQALRALLERCMAAISAPVAVGDRELLPSVSIGVTACNRPGEAVDRVLKAADVALYQAKRAGRGCYRLAGEATSEEAPAAPPKRRALR